MGDLRFRSDPGGSLSRTSHTASKLRRLEQDYLRECSEGRWLSAAEVAVKIVRILEADGDARLGEWRRLVRVCRDKGREEAPRG